ncbi:hypothetical protein ACHAXR_002923, partial [Thalassiosira sp. AJA248-18]
MSATPFTSMGLSLHHRALLKKPSNETTRIGKQDPPQLPIISSSGPSIPYSISSLPKKPMRPLTAYHIFFQIEREFVIQTVAGEDADKSIHDNKVYLNDVPQRYRNIKLLPDWYAGPGKRQKRKHRKQHGKIGFLELSRVISTRWAQLAEVDSETKSFVQKIAQQELDEYYREMKQYKELTKHIMPEAEKSVARPSVPKKKAKKRIRSSISSNNNSNTSLPVQPLADMVPSSYQPLDFISPGSRLLQNDIDYFLSRIDNNAQQLLSNSSSDIENQVQKKRKMY